MKLVTPTSPYLFILSSKRSNINLFSWQIDMSMKTFSFSCHFASNYFQELFTFLLSSVMLLAWPGWLLMNMRKLFFGWRWYLKIMFFRKWDIMIHGATNRVMYMYQRLSSLPSLPCNEKTFEVFWSL